MFFVRSVFYWASKGCPDAVPKGVIAIDLGDTVDQTSSIKELGLELCSAAFFDDTPWQVGCEIDDVDLVVKTIPHEQYGEIGQTLSSDQLIPDWQFQLLKQQPGLAVSEHSLADLECECC